MSALLSRPSAAFVVAAGFLLVAFAVLWSPSASRTTNSVNLNFSGSSVTLEEVVADETIFAGTTTYPQTLAATEGLITMAQNGGRVIDWNTVRNHRHSLEGHGAIIVTCVADLFQVVGATEGYLSHGNTVVGRGGKFPALAFVISLDDGLKNLGNRGCVGLNMSVVENEFGKAPKGKQYSWRQFYAVAVFGRALKMQDRWTMSETLFPVSAYFVYAPTRDIFEDWLCRWEFLSQFYPGTRAVDCRGRTVGR